MGNSIAFGSPGGDRDEDDDRDEFKVRDFHSGAVDNLIGTVVEQIAFRKGAMYDYCILRAIEIAIPDKTMRDIMIDGRTAIKGLECRTQKDDVNHLEQCIVSFNGTVLIKGTIKSSILPPDATHKDGVARVEMVDFWSIDGKNTHIYGDN